MTSDSELKVRQTTSIEKNSETIILPFTQMQQKDQQAL